MCVGGREGGCAGGGGQVVVPSPPPYPTPPHTPPTPPTRSSSLFLAAGDAGGTLRLLAYAPNHPDSWRGQRLLAWCVRACAVDGGGRVGGRVGGWVDRCVGAMMG